jgi:bifunctional UDP-N-acetylglucosamine pyrophosphorylase/glucosamine-1-phosphate N-acetyltransferase
MAVNNTQAVILAAGRSSRFNTGKSKLLEKICGQEMVLYLTKLLSNMNIPTTAVIGFQKELVKETITNYHGDAITFVEQEEQLGTGHALICTRQTWNNEHILVINGDMPLINQEILENLYHRHLELNATITFAISHQTDPAVGAYGRLVITDGVMEIIEARDFHGDPSEHCFINAGIYLIKRSYLEQAISQMQKNSSSKEFYITDLIKIASKAHLPVGSIVVPFDYIRGINTIEELWTAEQIKKAELIKYWMARGVRFYATHNLHIDTDVQIGAGTYIGCGVHVLRGTKIGQHCKINEMSSIYSSTLGDHVTVHPYTLVTDSIIQDHSIVGPFAHVHNQTVLEQGTTIGNFVEVKNSTIGQQTKAKHLAYLGDANIGKQVNIGAGTITCNYDGARKHTTTIKDGAFIGSNNTLVAPVTVEKNAYTAAGSTITTHVPENALAIARARQINKEQYAEKLRAQLQDKTDRQEPTAFKPARASEQENNI